MIELQGQNYKIELCIKDKIIDFKVTEKLERSEHFPVRY